MMYIICCIPCFGIFPPSSYCYYCYCYYYYYYYYY